MATYFKPDKTLPNRVVFKIDAPEIHYAKADGSVGVLQVDSAANTVGQQYQTTNTDLSTAIYAPVQNVLTVAPSGAGSQAISFGLMGQSVFIGSNALTAGGHLVGTMGWGVNNSNTTIPSGYGVEGRWDNQGTGTPVTTRGHGVLGLVVNQKGTITSAYGARTEFQGSAGTTTPVFYGFSTDVTVNAGTLTKFVAYGAPVITATVATKYFIENLDQGMPSLFKSPVIHQDYGYTVPTTGQTLQYPNLISDYTILPAATLAALTVALPTAPLDGQEITFSTTQIITTFTLTSAATIYNAPTSLTAGQCIKYKFLGNGVNVWIRKQ